MTSERKRSCVLYASRKDFAPVIFRAKRAPGGNSVQSAIGGTNVSREFGIGMTNDVCNSGMRPGADAATEASETEMKKIAEGYPRDIRLRVFHGKQGRWRKIRYPVSNQTAH